MRSQCEFWQHFIQGREVDANFYLKLELSQSQRKINPDGGLLNHFFSFSTENCFQKKFLFFYMSNIFFNHDKSPWRKTFVVMSSLEKIAKQNFLFLLKTFQKIISLVFTKKPSKSHSKTNNNFSNKSKELILFDSIPKWLLAKFWWK